MLDMVISTPQLAQLDEELLNLWEDPLTVIEAFYNVYKEKPEICEQILPGIGQFMQGNRLKYRACRKKIIPGLRFVLKQALEPALEKYDLIIIVCHPVYRYLLLLLL